MKNKFSENKGITLIALIITIIVMLILVGVTVNIALNGGLFDVTKKATIKQEIAIMQEVIDIEIVNLTAKNIEEGKDLEVSAKDIITACEMTSSKSITLGTEVKYISNVNIAPQGICYILEPSKLNVNTTRGNGSKEDGTTSDLFIIDSNKKIYYILEAQITQVKILSSLEKYILGNTGDGKNIAEIMDDSKKFIDDPDTEVDESKYQNLLTFMSETSGDGYISTTYMNDGNNIYKFNYLEGYDGTRKTIESSGLKIVDVLETARIGKFVKYDNKKWIIMYDDNINGLQMISENPSEKVYLGFGDENFTENEITELDGVEGKSRLEISLHSYNNVVKTLNNICEENVTPKEGVILGVRSVGSNPIYPNDDNPNEFIASDSNLPGYGTSTWFEDSLNLEKKVSGDKTYYIIKNSNPEVEYKIASNDSNYESDLDVLVALGILNTDYYSNTGYWLASRVLSTGSFGENAVVAFNARSSDSLDGGIDTMLFVLKERDSSVVDTENPSYTIRPVVTLNSDILNELITATETDSTLGNGESSETAWDLDAYLSANS